jgi:predicted Zn finger-like uncharacterized protein
MIVNCPSCSAHYRIKTEIIDPHKGRIVRCSACGNNWRVFIKNTPPVIDSKHKALVDKKSVPNNKNTQKTNSVPVETENTDNKPNDTQKQKTSIFVKIFVLTACYIFLMTLGYWLRFDIVKKFPQTERIYKLMGINVKVAGISIFEPYLEKTDLGNGKTSLTIIGTFVNSHRRDTLKIPPLSITLLNNDNMPIINFKKSDFKPDTLPPAGRYDFSYKIPSIPRGTVDVRIEFDTE